VAAAAVFTCALGYLGFWVYFANPFAGRAMTAIVCIGSLALLALEIARKGGPLLRLVRGAAFVLVFWAGIFYLSLMNLPASGTSESQTHIAATRFVPGQLPVDHVLPRLLADRIRDGADPRDLTPGWHSSDRPPLQTGAWALLGLPLRG